MTKSMWPRGRYQDVAGAVESLRGATVNRDGDQGWAAVGTWDIEIWFPWAPNPAGIPSLAAAESALAHLTELDDAVQADLETAAHRTTLDPQNFLFTLTFLTVEDDGALTLAYHGDRVNSEFDATFCPQDGGWNRV